MLYTRSLTYDLFLTGSTSERTGSTASRHHHDDALPPTLHDFAGAVPPRPRRRYAILLLSAPSSARLPCLPLCSCTDTRYSCSNADIPFLPAGLFEGRQTLTDVFLAGSNFTTIPAGIFVDLPVLTSITIFRGGLATYDSGAELPPSLTTLMIVSCRLSGIPLTGDGHE